MKRFAAFTLLACSLLLNIACGATIRIPVNPPTNPELPPPAPTVTLRPIAVNFTQPLTTATVTFEGGALPAAQVVPVVAGRAGFPVFPSNASVVNVHIRAAGYAPYDCVTNIPDGSYDFFVGPFNGIFATSNGYGQGWFVGADGWVCPRSLTPNAPPPPPPLPTPPLRASVLDMKITGQGLVVNTQQFGTLPWWEAALTYLNAADRAAVYAAKHASTAWTAGDTHAIVAVPSGRALYDEPGQPYSADRFGPLDWTNGGTKMVPEFDALVIELIQNHFTPMIFLDETEATSFATLPIIIDALQHSPAGDLTPYVVIGPGWDGVFYGWEPSHTVIPAWATLARSLCPKCYLFIEHNVGHIPLGEGPSDWTPTGLMKDFDLLLSEFWDGVFDDSVWQIAARTIGLVEKGGTYVRPADQPAGDDQGAPFYLAPGSVRGPFRACAFEFGMYGWVRGTSSAGNINGPWRQYFKNIGYTCGG